MSDTQLAILKFVRRYLLSIAGGVVWYNSLNDGGDTMDGLREYLLSISDYPMLGKYKVLTGWGDMQGCDAGDLVSIPATSNALDVFDPAHEYGHDTEVWSSLVTRQGVGE